MSASRVFRVQGPLGSAILKSNAYARESRFYTDITPVLRESSIGVPALLAATSWDDQHWLIVEDIPAPLPRERWDGDEHVLETLARLHTMLAMPRVDVMDMFAPTWTDEMTTAAIRRFPPESIDAIYPALCELGRAAQPLFRHLCYISGDPNPTNWGIRADGTVVLFDWERFGRGTPALDLAITVPGLGDSNAYLAVAGAYNDVRRRHGDTHNESPGRLARDIALAKAWTVVELLSGLETGRSDDADELLAMLIDSVPAWVARTDRWINAPEDH